jgi:hypothetical protein
MKRFAILDVSPFEGRSAGFVKNGPLCDAEQRLFLEARSPCKQSYNYRMMLIQLIDVFFYLPREKQQEQFIAYQKKLYELMVAYRPYSSARSPLPSSGDFYADVDDLVREIRKGSWGSVNDDKIINELLNDKDTRVYYTRLPEN